MAVTWHTISGDIGTIVGGVYESRRIKLWVSASTGSVVDLEDGTVLLGEQFVTVSNDGTFSVDVIATDSDDILPAEGLTYQVSIEYPGPSSLGVSLSNRRAWKSGWFAVTGDVNLSSVTASPASPPNASTPGLTNPQIFEAIEDAIEAHTPGIELGYASTTTGMTSTNTSIGTFHASLTVIVTGQGRAVDIELNIPGGVYHSVAGTETRAYIYGSPTIAGSNVWGLDNAISAYTTKGPGRILRCRQVLADGVDYSIAVGLAVAAAGTGTIAASSSQRLSLSVISR